MAAPSAIDWDKVPDPEVFFRDEPEHPLLPLPTKREVWGLLSAQGADGLRKVLQHRRERIEAGHRDPLQAPRPKVWRIAERMLRSVLVKLLVLLGGNRSTKSFYCADSLMRSVLRAVDYNSKHGFTHPTTFLVGSDSEVNSAQTTQALVWHFLPQAFKAMNQMRSAREKRAGIDINYTPGDGFADRVLALGHGVIVRFVLYSNDPANFEGAEFGAKDYRDVAWWMDEALTLPWYNMLRRRGRFRPGYGLWSFTPIRGITPTIKEAVGTGKVLRTRRAVLLPANQELVKGLRPGRVPFVQSGSAPDVGVIYYHSDLTPFSSGGRKYTDAVAADCKGKPPAYVLRIFYGYTEDTVGRAFPTFSQHVHVVPQEKLPDIGTNYLFIDPAGGRNYFMLWVRVVPGTPKRLFLYRDWPDMDRYGEWAVPTERAVTRDSRRGWDGDPGPAQIQQGWGVTQYKEMIRKEETISTLTTPEGGWVEKDPYRVRRLNQWVAEVIRAKKGPPWTSEEIEKARRSGRPAPTEGVLMRKIDPRAGMNPLAAEKGGTNLIEMFASRQDGPFGDPMDILPAYSGKGIDEGTTHVAELLQYRTDQPICPFVNEPRLYVADNCRQVIWMFENYTGWGGEDGACKDPADLVRYIAQDEELVFIQPDALRPKPGTTY